MNEKEPSAFISALTTEHFVLQSALSNNTSEVGTRASLYLFSLSSSLVALGLPPAHPSCSCPSSLSCFPPCSSSGFSRPSGW
jgi:hypothetical protein